MSERCRSRTYTSELWVESSTDRSIMSRRLAIIGLSLILLLAATGTSGASSSSSGSQDTTVLDWNRHAVEALINAPAAPVPGAGQSPPVSMLQLAMVQGAVYDAVNMIHRGYESVPRRSAQGTEMGIEASGGRHRSPPCPRRSRDRTGAPACSCGDHKTRRSLRRHFGRNRQRRGQDGGDRRWSGGSRSHARGANRGRPLRAVLLRRRRRCRGVASRPAGSMIHSPGSPTSSRFS